MSITPELTMLIMVLFLFYYGINLIIDMKSENALRRSIETLVMCFLFCTLANFCGHYQTKMLTYKEKLIEHNIGVYDQKTGEFLLK